jgi:16S rRNA (guanine1207-N2)-methyltransferase
MAPKATVVPVTSPAAGDDSGHYFAEAAAVESRPRSVGVVLPDLSLTLTSDRGVFSSDRLDPGTRLLLLEMPPVGSSENTILDLGCGWGPIACVAARRAPHATVWAIDVNRRARELTAANAESVGVAVRVAAPSDVPEEVRFDRILSNPPIRIGKSALHDLLAQWLDRLQPGGRAHLVVQRHLGSDSLARWLVARGHPVQRLASRWGYRLLEVASNTAERV